MLGGSVHVGLEGGINSSVDVWGTTQQRPALSWGSSLCSRP
jgi:hypothetical protein